MLAAALLLACRLLDPGVSSRADSPWVEVRSPAFRVLAEVDAARATSACQDAELFRAVLGAVTNARAEPRVPTTLVVFESAATVGNLAGSRKVAGLMSPGLRDNVALVFAGRAHSLDGQSVLFHEYSHLVLNNENERLYPLWYHEGFAEFFSALRIEDARVVVGEFPRHQEAVWARGVSIPIGDVIAARTHDGWSAQKTAAFYHRSWLLTHYLILGQPPRPPGQPSGLSRYLARQVAPEQSEQVWREVFGTDFAGLERALDAYTKDGEIPARALDRARLAPAACAPPRVLGQAEAARELGWLALRMGQADEARPLFEQALRGDPKDSRAHAGLGECAKLEGDWAQAGPHYQRALSLAPDDARNQLDFAKWALSRPEGIDADQLASARGHLEAATKLEPGGPEAYVVLAQTYLMASQDPNQGVPHAQRAAQLLPSHEQVQLTLAQLYLAAGDRTAARRRLERLAAWSHGTLADQAQALLVQLDPDSAPGDGHSGDAQGGRGGSAEP